MSKRKSSDHGSSDPEKILRDAKKLAKQRVLSKQKELDSLIEHFLPIVKMRVTNSAQESGDQKRRELIPSVHQVLDKIKIIRIKDIATAKRYEDGVYEIYSKGFVPEMREQHKKQHERNPKKKYVEFACLSKKDYDFSGSFDTFLILLYKDIPVGFIQYIVDEELNTCYTHHLYTADKKFVQDHIDSDNEYIWQYGFRGLKLGPLLFATANAEAYFLRHARHFLLYVSPDAPKETLNLYRDFGYTDAKDQSKEIKDIVALAERNRRGLKKYSWYFIQKFIIEEAGDMVLYKDEATDEEGYKKKLDNYFRNGSQTKDLAMKCRCCNRSILGSSIVMPRLWNILRSDHPDPCF